MHRVTRALLLAALATDAHAAAAAETAPVPAVQSGNRWYEAGELQALRTMPAAEAGHARNVILFLGDGMGMSTVTAARIFAGQAAGRDGESHRLSFEDFPQTALIRTYNTDAQTPDSAGTMSAIMTGVKTRMGVFGVDEAVGRGECGAMAGHELVSALMLAELQGKATGVVTTARVTHATPAATYGRSAERDWEDDSALPEEARAQGCRDIAAQLVSHRDDWRAALPRSGGIDGIEVLLGGGRRHFLPRSLGGRRADGRNLVEEWQQHFPGGRYVADAEGLAALPREAPVLGLFSDSHMSYEADRVAKKRSEPSLTEMTRFALDVLEQDKDGFFLMVESGRIDHAHHAGNAFNALNETAEFARAIEHARARSSENDTLIIVTADHSHVFTMGGYPRRNNPILGKVVAPGATEPTRAADGRPYTTLSYANGLGMHDLGNETDADAVYDREPVAGRAVDLGGIDTEKPGFHQEATVPLRDETHGGEDVPAYAWGPGAGAVRGSLEQNVLFHIMVQAAGLVELPAP